MKRYILDSYAMLAFFEDEAGADVVADILNELIRKKAHGFMSVINWGELYLQYDAGTGYGNGRNDHQAVQQVSRAIGGCR